MAEQLHTIPISDAMDNAGECPFCYIERRVENQSMDFVLGHCASYMEADIRDLTDRQGFCRTHFKKMYDYGNALGNAWILKTLLMRNMNEMTKEFKQFNPNTSGKKSLFGKSGEENSIVEWINRRESTCFICNNVNHSFQAYMKTFFMMYRDKEDFRKQVKQTKGFCLTHFKFVCQGADQYLSGKVREEFYNCVLPLMSENMDRVFEDISWFIEKFDYKNKDADWKNSKDALERGMQKLRGTDPSLPPHVLKK